MTFKLIAKEDQIRSVKKKIKQARANYLRQRNKEELNQDVRVSSSFWEQVGYDYKRELARLEAK